MALLYLSPTGRSPKGFGLSTGVGVLTDGVSGSARSLLTVPTVRAQKKASVPASIATPSQPKSQAPKSQATPPTVEAESKPTGPKPNGTMTSARRKCVVNVYEDDVHASHSRESRLSYQLLNSTTTTHTTQ